MTEITLDPSFFATVDKGIQSGKKISMITHVLGDIGEEKLKYIFSSILNQVGRIDLMELLYTSAKELIVNSTKAAIKRVIFEEGKLNIHNEEDYEKGMKLFKSNLNEKKFPSYKKNMKDAGYQVKITCFLKNNKLTLEIRNNFPLIAIEAKRIQEKLMNAKKYENLFEFFMEHGDNTEGAGMGITMVEILLSQSGFDRRLFSIYSSEKKNETVARVEFPLDPILAINIKSEQLLVE